ncbi:LPXTG cell wall anchor domain-containing protein, partial [Enterococcus faecalis]|uniref:LPXTG cell wall anchor domain-containing protein n=1 Tax=Enterococcus faecalis TaxID=1351 RepID=UPI000353ADE3
FTETEQTVTYVYKTNKKESSGDKTSSKPIQSANKNKVNHKELLPKTGERRNGVHIIVGILLLSSSMLLFSFRRKKQKR